MPPHCAAHCFCCLVNLLKFNLRSVHVSLALAVLVFLLVQQPVRVGKSEIGQRAGASMLLVGRPGGGSAPRGYGGWPLGGMYDVGEFKVNAYQ